MARSASAFPPTTETRQTSLTFSGTLPIFSMTGGETDVIQSKTSPVNHPRISQSLPARRIFYECDLGKPVAGAHARLAKAAQAAAIVVAASVLAIPVFTAGLVSCRWPHEEFMEVPQGVFGAISLIFWLVALFVVMGGVVIAHAATRPCLRATPVALPSSHWKYIALFNGRIAFQHIWYFGVIGFFQLPAFAVLCHGFQVPPFIFHRLAPAVRDLQLCCLVGAISGMAYSISWHVYGFNVLDVASKKAALLLQAKRLLLHSLRPCCAVFAFGCVVATLLNAVMSPYSHDLSQLEVLEQASVYVDLSGLRRWWICVESLSFCLVCWNLSCMVVVSVLSQPFDFVSEAPITFSSGVKSSQRARFSADETGALDGLLFALNASLTCPSLDPSGLLGVLSVQNLLEIATGDAKRRAPIFADADGIVWNSVLLSCLTPVDRLSYRLWAREKLNAPRKELPVLFHVQQFEYLSLYQNVADTTTTVTSNFDNEFCISTSHPFWDTTLYGDSRRLTCGAEALSKLIVASRSEDQYGVVQRSLVDAVTSMLQCYSKVSSQDKKHAVLITQHAHEGSIRSPRCSLLSNEEFQRREWVKCALEQAIDRIVSEFGAYIATYIHGSEPRWDPRFNSDLLLFLDRKSQQFAL